MSMEKKESFTVNDLETTVKTRVRGYNVCCGRSHFLMIIQQHSPIIINSTDRAEGRCAGSCLRHVRCLVLPPRAFLNHHSLGSVSSFAQCRTPVLCVKSKDEVRRVVFMSLCITTFRIEYATFLAARSAWVAVQN